MALDDSPKRPRAPDLQPPGPIVRGADAALWNEASGARAAVERYAERTRAWARAAYERERLRGYAEGREAGAIEASRLVAHTLSETRAYREALERDLPRLVMQILEEILGQFDPGQLLVQAVRRAVAELPAGGGAQLRVAPGRADMLARALADVAPINRTGMIPIEPDPTLSPDQCILWSSFGNVDLSLEAQIRALRLGLAAGVGAESRT